MKKLLWMGLVVLFLGGCSNIADVDDPELDGTEGQLAKEVADLAKIAIDTLVDESGGTPKVAAGNEPDSVDVQWNYANGIAEVTIFILKDGKTYRSVSKNEFKGANGSLVTLALGDLNVTNVAQVVHARQGTVWTEGGQILVTSDIDAITDISLVTGTTYQAVLNGTGDANLLGTITAVSITVTDLTYTRDINNTSQDDWGYPTGTMHIKRPLGVREADIIFDGTSTAKGTITNLKSNTKEFTINLDTGQETEI